MVDFEKFVIKHEVFACASLIETRAILQIRFSLARPAIPYQSLSVNMLKVISQPIDGVTALKKSEK